MGRPARCRRLWVKEFEAAKMENGMVKVKKVRGALAGRKALVIGVANEHSIAWGCARAFHELGAEVAITYLNEKAKPHVQPGSGSLAGI